MWTFIRFAKEEAFKAKYRGEAEGNSDLRIEWDQIWKTGLHVRSYISFFDRTDYTLSEDKGIVVNKQE